MAIYSIWRANNPAFVAAVDAEGTQASLTNDLRIHCSPWPTKSCVLLTQIKVFLPVQNILMRIPTISGIIDRRILANYRVDPTCMAAQLPPPFRPQIVNGFAVGGICLIRLKQVRPKLLPVRWGLSSENAAHRIAVEWESEGKLRQGVYIPRRDSNSILNSLVGGKIFPGLHHRARFTVVESSRRHSVRMKSDDGTVTVDVSGTVADTFPNGSVFESLIKASDFFAQGSLGYSDTTTLGRFDGLELKCDTWQVEPLDVDSIQSSFFEDSTRFPAGSVEFDCALLMRDIVHEWRGHPDLCCPPK